VPGGRISSRNKGLALAYAQGLSSLPTKRPTRVAPFTLHLPRCCCSSIFFSKAFLSSRPFTRILILALRFRLSLALSPLINDMSSPRVLSLRRLTPSPLWTLLAWSPSIPTGGFLTSHSSSNRGSGAPLRVSNQ
jgi:hypothetical protein